MSSEHLPPNMAKELVITLGQKGDDVASRSGLPVKRSRVSTALLYDASPDRLGADVPVVIALGPHRAAMPPLDSVLFYDDTEEPHGVEQVDLHVRLPRPPEGAVAATDAWRDYERQLHRVVMSSLAALNMAGWQRHFEPDSARIQGTDSYSPRWKTDPDPAYPLSLEEWRAFATTTRQWLWRLDGARAQLVFRPGRGGSFVIDSLSFRFMSDRLYLAHNDPRGTGDATAGRAQMLKDGAVLAERRRQHEAQARAAGVPIMDQWVDLPMEGAASRAR